MRGLTLAAVLLVGALTLSGCSSKSNTSSTTGTGTPNGGSTHTGTVTNTTTLPPNIPPIVVVHVSNATGAPTNVTFVRGSLSFSAVGSSDPDGDGLSAIAIVAQDSNRTYPPGVLFAGGKFTSVTYTFDRPGIVNVTVSGIDVRGDLTTLRAQVYVDEKQHITSKSIKVPTGSTTNNASDCQGPAAKQGLPSAAILDANVYDSEPIDLVKGAQLLTGHLVSGTGHYAFCGPPAADGSPNPVSGDDSGGNLQSNKPLPPAKGTATYSVGFVSTDPQGSALVVDVIVHYEPTPAK
jgi:hypothetical protein